MPAQKYSSQEWVKTLSSQEGIVSTAQARALGASAHAIAWQVSSGRWQRIYQGVYATFSGKLSREAKLWAVVLRIGPNAVLSHETAAEVQGVIDGPSSRIHVTVPAERNPSRWADLRGVVIHRSVNCRADPQPPWQLPRTPINETILDLAASANSLDDAYAWLSRAVTRRLTTTGLLADALAARKKIARRAWLADALTDVGDGVHFPLEGRWVRDVERAHGLPKATRQARRASEAGVRCLDNLYEPYGLCAELDGAAFHLPEDRAADRRRDNEAAISDNVTILRYGFPEVASHPCDQAVQFARALIARGWPATTLKPCGPECPVALLVQKSHDHG